MRPSSSKLGRTAAVFALAASTAIALSGRAQAVTTPSGLVASGSGWSVTTVPGGYSVKLELGEGLPVKDDLPELTVDGADLGPAVESADGKTLTLTTSDPAVATAQKIGWRWASQPQGKSTVKPGVSPKHTSRPSVSSDPLDLSTGA